MRLVIPADASSGCLRRHQLLCLYITNHQLSSQRANRTQTHAEGDPLVIYSRSPRFHHHRATGGPEVAMGTGPWPQPPTEAEQLQALMAAANGECYTTHPLPVLCQFLLSIPNHLSSQAERGSVGREGLLRFLFGCRASSQTGSLMKLCHVHASFSIDALQSFR